MTVDAMPVHVSADMAGVTGLVDADDVQAGGRDHERGRSMMAEYGNAAVRGALAAGASDILVNDAHGPMRRLCPDDPHPAARLVRGRPKRMIMLGGGTGSTTPWCVSAVTPAPGPRARSATASWATRPRAPAGRPPDRRDRPRPRHGDASHSAVSAHAASSPVRAATGTPGAARWPPSR
ncbi:M55 family metallopeptidase [Streptomyces sp. NPDC014983]|uniref:M55 family metallopeptidase n=1 Tax=Streptomyces sp. NPDC014983 TaxID=3364933 RepID=UPI0036FB928A